MKKQMKNQSSFTSLDLRKLAVAAFFTVATLGSVKAQNTTLNSPEAQISYVGISDSKYIFQVNFQNEGAETFKVQVKDHNGYEFYTGNFNDKQFKKKFAISKEDLENNSITFTISTKKNDKEQTFDINSTSRFVQEVSVVKL